MKVKKIIDKVTPIYKAVRKINSVTGRRFIYYLIKTYLESGYDEVATEKDFRDGYDTVMEFVGLNPNLQRIIKEYGIETDYSILSQWNRDS